MNYTDELPERGDLMISRNFDPDTGTTLGFNVFHTFGYFKSYRNGKGKSKRPRTIKTARAWPSIQETGSSACSGRGVSGER